jgi:hypothetical protein
MASDASKFCLLILLLAWFGHVCMFQVTLDVHSHSGKRSPSS